MVVFMPIGSYIFNGILNIDYRRVIQLLAFFGFIVVLLLKPSKLKRVIFPKYLLFYILYAAYTYVSEFIFLDREFKGTYLFSNRLLGGIALLFIIENIYIPHKFFRSTLKYHTGILFFAFVTILIQQTFMPDFFVNPDTSHVSVGEFDANEGRLPSIYSWTGNLLVTGFAFVPMFLILIEDLQFKRKKIFIWVILGLLFCFLTKNRWIMLNAILVFFLIFKHNKNKSKQFFKYAIILPLTVIIVTFSLKPLGVDLQSIAEDRVLESGKKAGFENKSASSRLLAFTLFGKVFMDNPIFGIGDIKYGMAGTGEQDYKLMKMLNGKSSQLHVGYLSLFYMFGLVGGGFFLLFLYFILRKFYINAKKTGKWAPFLGILGFAIANLTLVTFHFFQIGLLFALVTDRYYMQIFERNKLLKRRLHAQENS